MSSSKYTMINDISRIKSAPAPKALMISPINPSNDIDDDLICASSTAKPLGYRSLARGDPAHVRAYGREASACGRVHAGLPATHERHCVRRQRTRMRSEPGCLSISRYTFLFQIMDGILDDERT